jgi:Spy/CpxP family protein refolding chaperone
VWQVLAAAGAALVVGAAVPGMARMHAAALDESVAVAVQNPAQGGAKSGAQGTNDRKPGMPPPISATQEWDWWNDPAIRKQLGLSDEKAKKLQSISQRRVAEIQPWVDKLNRERQKLYLLTEARVADETTYSMQVANVEFLAAKFRESRTIMLYRMFRELTPDQYRKLQEITDQRMADMRRRGAGPGR